jgi:hypothetical protein
MQSSWLRIASKYLQNIFNGLEHIKLQLRAGIALHQTRSSIAVLIWRAKLGDLLNRGACKFFAADQGRSLL